MRYSCNFTTECFGCGIAGADLQRIVDTNGKIWAWCRRCSGHTRVKLGVNCRTVASPLLTKRKTQMLKRIHKLEEVELPGRENLET